MRKHDGRSDIASTQRGIRLYWRFFAAAMLCALCFVGWAFLDASFPLAMRVFAWMLGVGSLSSDSIAYHNALSWDSLGARVFAFCVLLAAAAISSTLSALYLVRTRLQKSSRLRYWSIGVMASLYSTIALGYSWLEWQGVAYRCIHVLPRFKAAAESLRKDWPQKSAVVPEAGRASPDPDQPSRLILFTRGYPVKEDFGSVVVRTEKPLRIRFELAGAYDCCIEFCPDATPPNPYKTKSGEVRKVHRWRQLDDKWQVVQYRVARAE